MSVVMRPAPMRLLRLALVLAVGAAVLWVWTGGVRAQQDEGPPATLIADDIAFDRATGEVAAQGNVEIFHRGIRLRAGAIRYQGDSDRVQVEGPITLIDETGQTVILAEFADLSRDLQDGVLRSARLVLDRQLQIAAAQIDRVDGRFTQLHQSIASSCEVCFDNPTPLWEIRARRITHDALERQLYFDDATFRVLGVPIAYLPRLRLPDPTLERASGFLTPSLRASDETGTQLRFPYFITLGDSADLTLTPWIGIGDSRTVQLRYRQAFRTGQIEINGALTEDDLTDDDLRGFFFADGSFAVPRGFQFDFAIESVTDRGYLTTYGFPDEDFLETFASLSRTERDQYIELRASRFTSLQEGDDNETLPTRVLSSEITQRFVPGRLGGIATVGLNAGGYQRPSDVPGIDGRDVARITGSLDWRRDVVFASGLQVAVETALFAEVFSISQDPAFDGTEARVTPFIGVELRYPLLRRGAGGVTHLIEPVAQLVWSEQTGGPVPNEDGQIVEFDEANLFSLDRFPGQDERETGRRLNLGVGYTRVDPLGWSASLLGGVVLRDSDAEQFTQGSGLDGMQSDFLVAAHLAVDDRLNVINRALFDAGFTFTSNELMLGWTGERHLVQTSYTWLIADDSEGRPLDTAEWALDARYDLSTDWSARANWRYDFVTDDATRAGLGLTYANECVDMEFSVSRRFTSATNVEPATEFGVSVSLNGFGAGRSGRSQNRSCLR